MYEMISSAVLHMQSFCSQVICRVEFSESNAGTELQHLFYVF